LCVGDQDPKLASINNQGTVPTLLQVGLRATSAAVELFLNSTDAGQCKGFLTESLSWDVYSRGQCNDAAQGGQESRVERCQSLCNFYQVGPAVLDAGGGWVALNHASGPCVQAAIDYGLENLTESGRIYALYQEYLQPTLPCASASEAMGNTVIGLKDLSLVFVIYGIAVIVVVLGAIIKKVLGHVATSHPYFASRIHTRFRFLVPEVGHRHPLAQSSRNLLSEGSAGTHFTNSRRSLASQRSLAALAKQQERLDTADSADMADLLAGLAEQSRQMHAAMEGAASALRRLPRSASGEVRTHGRQKSDGVVIAAPAPAHVAASAPAHLAVVQESKDEEQGWVENSLNSLNRLSLTSWIFSDPVPFLGKSASVSRA